MQSHDRAQHAARQIYDFVFERRDGSATLRKAEELYRQQLEPLHDASDYSFSEVRMLDSMPITARAREFALVETCARVESRCKTQLQANGRPPPQSATTSLATSSIRKRAKRPNKLPLVEN